jgi:uncharacterized protein (TIGR02145 family)
MKNIVSVLILFLGIVRVELAQTITIGTQVWSTQNLNVSTFRNGDPIPQAKSDEDWKKAGDNKQPAWCYYENRSIQNDPVNGEKYGKLYNWYAVNDPRGLAPKGWHIPTDDEWTKLTNFLGGEDIAGKKMKSTSGWKVNFNGNSGNGTNESGFNGLPGGFRNHKYGESLLISIEGTWWSSSEYDADTAWYRYILNNYMGCSRYHNFKTFGLAVRCVKD